MHFCKSHKVSLIPTQRPLALYTKHRNTLADTLYHTTTLRYLFLDNVASTLPPIGLPPNYPAQYFSSTRNFQLCLSGITDRLQSLHGEANLGL